MALAKEQVELNKDKYHVEDALLHLLLGSMEAIAMSAGVVLKIIDGEFESSDYGFILLAACGIMLAIFSVVRLFTKRIKVLEGTAMNRERYHAGSAIIQFIIGSILAFGMMNGILQAEPGELDSTYHIFYSTAALAGCLLALISLYRLIRRPIKVYEGYLVQGQTVEKGWAQLYRFVSTPGGRDHAREFSVTIMTYKFVLPHEFKEGWKYRLYYDPWCKLIMEKEVLEKKKRKIYINNLQ